MSAISTALVIFLCTIPASAQYVIRRRRTPWPVVVGVICAAVGLFLFLCCCFMILRRRRRVANNTTPAVPISTGKPLFGGPWGRQQPAPPLNGPVPMGYQGNVAMPPPAYSKGGGYATNQQPPV